jgi:hypothetical protein
MMKSKKSQSQKSKLIVSRESIRLLSNASLRGVAGGIITVDDQGVMGCTAEVVGGGQPAN